MNGKKSTRKPLNSVLQIYLITQGCSLCAEQFYMFLYKQVNPACMLTTYTALTVRRFAVVHRQ